MDLVGPLPECDGHRYLLVMYDVLSHLLRIEVIDTKQDSANLDAFIRGVVLEGYLSLIIATDNGTEFRNRLMATLLLQFKMRYRAAYVLIILRATSQNVNRFIVAMLRACIESTKRHATDWVEFARYVAFIYNRIYIPGTQVSRFMMRHGQQSPLPQDLNIVEDATALPQPKKKYLDALVSRTQHYHDLVVHAHAKAQRKKAAVRS